MVLLDDNLNGNNGDFVLTLRDRLIKAGFENSDIRLSESPFEIDETTSFHTGLIILVLDGDFYNCDSFGIRKNDLLSYCDVSASMNSR